MSNSDTIIEVDYISKQYRLGEVWTGSLGHDLNRAWHRLRGKPDPYLKVTHANDRTQEAHGEEFVWALEDIDFQVERGEVLGIIGRNGAGKSTLLKILSRVTAPTTGEIRVDGRIASLLEVGTGFHQDLTGRENIFLNGAILGMSKAEIGSKLDEIVDFSGCARYLDTPVKRYSSGMMVRLGFAVAAHLEPDILIVDEVLAVGDAEFQKKCLGKMQDVAGHGRSILFVSHNMASVSALTERCLILDQGRVVFSGKTHEAVERYGHTGDECSLLGARAPLGEHGSAGAYSPDPRVSMQEIGICPGASSTIPVGGKLELDLLLKAEVPLGSMRIGYSVRTRSEVGVLNGYSRSFCFEQKGLFACRLTLCDLQLSPGDYELCLGLNTGGVCEAKHLFQVIIPVGLFRVESRMAGGGVVHEWKTAWGHIVHTASELTT